MTRESAILQLFQTHGLGATRLRRLLKALEEKGLALEAFVSDPDRGLLQELSLNDSVREAVLEAEAEAQELLRLLAPHDIRVLTFLDPGYPTKMAKALGKNAPPMLFVHGCLSVLEQKCVGFCGSRHASPKGIDFTQRTAEVLAQQGINVVSGYATGVDTAAHVASSRAGGVTTIVLAEGILQFRMKPDLGEPAEENRLLVMSEFPPRLPWIAHNAMRRNSTICGLSDAVVVVEAGRKGGSIESGRAALKLGIPLFVVRYSEAVPSAEGNEELIRSGGNAIDVEPDGDFDVQALMKALAEADNATRNNGNQYDLFDMTG